MFNVRRLLATLGSNKFHPREPKLVRTIFEPTTCLDFTSTTSRGDRRKLLKSDAKYEYYRRVEEEEEGVVLTPAPKRSNYCSILSFHHPIAPISSSLDVFCVHYFLYYCSIFASRC